MGDIVPFLARVRSSGDWTAMERARLEELAERFSAIADGIEVVFGATDEGDPWCVVKDAQDEILVHVARIGGRFIVHYALDDALQEGAALPDILGERLHWEEDERDDVVVPFSRQAQSLLALIVATAFYYETRHLETGRPKYGQPDSGAPDAALGDDVHTAQAAEAGFLPAAVAAKAGLAAAGALSWPTRSFASEPDPAPVPGKADGWSVADQAYGGSPAAAPVLLGMSSSGPVEARPSAFAPVETSPFRNLSGPANDAPGSDPGGPVGPGGGDPPAPPPEPPGVEGLTGGRQWLLEGSDDADRLDMSETAVAVGGAGGDVFVLHAPGQMGLASNNLGVIADFNTSEGDRMLTADGRLVQVLAVNQTSTTLTAVPDSLRVGTMGLKTTSFTASASESVVVAGRQLEVDLDGDGKADGYVILLSQSSRAPSDTPEELHAAAMEPMLLATQSFNHLEF